MWNMSQHGFVSVVHKQGGLMVRSRDRASIETFCDLAKIDRSRIVEGGGTDYQYRIRRVSKRDVKRYFAAEVDAIDYDNFKNRVKDLSKTYANALGSVWGVMWRICDVPAKTSKPKHRAAGTSRYDAAYETSLMPYKRGDYLAYVEDDDAVGGMLAAIADDPELQAQIREAEEFDERGNDPLWTGYDPDLEQDGQRVVSISSMTDAEFRAFEASSGDCPF